MTQKIHPSLKQSTLIQPVIVVHFKRGLECLNALLFCVYTESYIFYIIMLYIYTNCVGGRNFSIFVEQDLQFMYEYIVCLKGQG